MSFLKRFFGQTQGPQRTPVHADDDDLVEVYIVGEASYQPALKKLAAGKNRRDEALDVTVRLATEPSNRYDKNAVVATIDGLTVGYLSRDAAIGFHSYMASQGQGKAAREGRAQLDGIQGKIVGGRIRDGAQTHFGVLLFLPEVIAECLQ